MKEFRYLPSIARANMEQRKIVIEVPLGDATLHFEKEFSTEAEALAAYDTLDEATVAKLCEIPR